MNDRIDLIVIPNFIVWLNGLYLGKIRQENA